MSTNNPFCCVFSSFPADNVCTYQYLIVIHATVADPGEGGGEGSIRYRLQAHSKLLKSGQANECGLAISMRPGIL